MEILGQSGSFVRTQLKQPWQQELLHSFWKPEDLLRFLEIDPIRVRYSELSSKKFSLRVTRSYLSRIPKGDPNHPLFLQIWPQFEEEILTPGFTKDCVGELSGQFGEAGIIQKYSSRALLITTGQCAIHCRYCFRRHVPYGDKVVTASEVRAAVASLDSESRVREVILSGGDPLCLSDEKISVYFDAMLATRNIQTLRIHSRIPVVLPSRMTSEWMEMCRKVTIQKSLVLVTHINHPDEIDQEVMDCILKLKEICPRIQLLNQSVLLKRVNDSVDVLQSLSYKLQKCGIQPYYLHALDRVEGASHFEVSDDLGLELIQSLRSRISGYLVPKFVREIAGAESKVEVS